MCANTLISILFKMISIKSNKITADAELLGQELRQAREGKKIKIEEAAAKLKISARYLSALEAGDLKKLPAGIYAKKFLAEYARFLGLRVPEALAGSENESPGNDQRPNDRLFSLRKPGRGYFFAIPRLLKNALIVLAVTACLSYLGLCFKRVTAAPLLALESPAQNLVTAENSLEIIGSAEPEAKVAVNGEYVLTDTAGNFRQKINLKNGLNTIFITAQKQYSRQTAITRNVMVKSPDL